MTRYGDPEGVRRKHDKGLPWSELGAVTRRKAIAITRVQLATLMDGATIPLAVPVIDDYKDRSVLWVGGPDGKYHLVRIDEIKTDKMEVWVGKIVAIDNWKYTHMDDPTLEELREMQEEEENEDTD